MFLEQMGVFQTYLVRDKNTSEINYPKAKISKLFLVPALGPGQAHGPRLDAFFPKLCESYFSCPRVFFLFGGLGWPLGGPMDLLTCIALREGVIYLSEGVPSRGIWSLGAMGEGPGNPRFVAMSHRRRHRRAQNGPKVPKNGILSFLTHSRVHGLILPPN